MREYHHTITLHYWYWKGDSVLQSVMTNSYMIPAGYSQVWLGKFINP
jgi:hypothetical protein